MLGVQHPGGDEVILAEAGTSPMSYLLSSSHHGTVARDATEAFEDVGHSDEARALLKDMLVGDFEPTDVSSIPIHPLHSFPTPLCP